MVDRLHGPALGRHHHGYMTIETRGPAPACAWTCNKLHESQIVGFSDSLPPRINCAVTAALPTHDHKLQCSHDYLHHTDATRKIDRTRQDPPPTARRRRTLPDGAPLRSTCGRPARLRTASMDMGCRHDGHDGDGGFRLSLRRGAFRIWRSGQYPAPGTEESPNPPIARANR